VRVIGAHSFPCSGGSLPLRFRIADPGEFMPNAAAPSPSPYAQPPMLIAFSAGDTGPWRIDEIRTIIGDPLRAANAIDMSVAPQGAAAPLGAAAWVLRGFTSNMRYTTRREADAMAPRTAPLGRTGATRAALIPIRKSSSWWAMTQDERREIYEERSRHTSIGIEYMPDIARRLHHARDLGEPFDFLTWFEYAPDREAAFDELLRRLRASEEWAFVEREVEVRVTLDV